MARDQGQGLFKSLFLTYLILVLHGVLLILFALLVVFFRGVFEYLPWILAAGLLIIASCCWLLWRRFRRGSADLAELLDQPVLRDRAVEVRLLGGMASLRLGAPAAPSSAGREAIAIDPVTTPRLEDEEAQRLRRLARLIKLRDGGEISEGEFQALRQDLLGDGTSVVVPQAPRDETGPGQALSGDR